VHRIAPGTYLVCMDNKQQHQLTDHFVDSYIGKFLTLRILRAMNPSLTKQQSHIFLQKTPAKNQCKSPSPSPLSTAHRTQYVNTLYDQPGYTSILLNNAHHSLRAKSALD